MRVITRGFLLCSVYLSNPPGVPRGLIKGGSLRLLYGAQLGLLTFPCQISFDASYFSRTTSNLFGTTLVFAGMTSTFWHDFFFGTTFIFGANFSFLFEETTEKVRAQFTVNKMAEIADTVETMEWMEKVSNQLSSELRNHYLKTFVTETVFYSVFFFETGFHLEYMLY